GNNAYRLYELERGSLKEFIRSGNVGGLNITIPYKVEAMKYCDVISPEAEEIGAVNTVVRKNGRVYGFNTDKYGFIYMLEKGGIDVIEKKVIVLGSGGASKTACYCVKKLGAKEVTVISRSGSDNYGNISKHFDAEIIINATPVGMFPENGNSPIELENFTSCEGVADMIYNPLRTKLLLDSERLGIKYTGGLSMLTAQAKKAAEYFFDTEYPDSITDKITDEIIRECENIVIIGMPGSGKSVIGKALAKITGREVFDTDTEIEKNTGKSIPRIFSEDGEEKFRETESETLAYLGKQNGKIIVTGGGAVTVEKNYLSLKQNGRIYETVRDISLLSRDGRPLSQGANLYEMYAERRPMYEKFRDVSINNNKTPEDAAEEIRRDFYENSRY
ncbi:MAG: shikimate kinase, partial [Clostridia bacterium]|nr:shikimate kinase [Clostridia bacterium]